MFWDRVAGIYDLFVNVYNRKVHKELCRRINELIGQDDEVLECACGTGMLTVGIAQRCQSLVATDFSDKMLEKAAKKCASLDNVHFEKANILKLGYPDQRYDKVVAANVIHLLDEPLKALSELDRVCRPGGRIIIPTYMNKEKTGEASSFSKTVGKAGADFRQEFTYSSYQHFFGEAGYDDADYVLIKGRVPCAVAVLSKKL